MRTMMLSLAALALFAAPALAQEPSTNEDYLLDAGFAADDADYIASFIDQANACADDACVDALIASLRARYPDARLEDARTALRDASILDRLPLNAALDTGEGNG